MAELSAAYLFAHAGIEPQTIENSGAYIDHWIRKLKRDKKLVVQAAGSARKATEWIQGG